MEPLILCGRKRRTNTASRFYQDQDTHSYAAHLHLNDRAHEISTVHPAASVSSYLDHPCGPALLLSRRSHFAGAAQSELECEHRTPEWKGYPASASTHTDAHARVISGNHQD